MAARGCFNWIPSCAKQAAWDSRVQICIENCILEMPLSRQLVQIIGRNKFSIRFESLCWILRVSLRTRKSQNQAKANYKDCSFGNRNRKRNRTLVFRGVQIRERGSISAVQIGGGSKSAVIPGFFCQRHEVRCINFGEIPSRSII